jgi:hypothetical protein
VKKKYKSNLHFKRKIPGKFGEEKKKLERGQGSEKIVANI